MQSQQLQQVQQQLNTLIKQLNQKELDMVYQNLIDASLKVTQAINGIKNRERDKKE